MQIILFILFLFVGCNTLPTDDGVATSFLYDQDPFPLDSVTVSINHRKQQMELFFDPRTNLVDISAKIDGTTYFTAVLTEEIRWAITETWTGGEEKIENCLFGWGNLKITSDCQGLITITKKDDGLILHFESPTYNREFSLFVEDGKLFTNLIFQENLTAETEAASESEDEDF